MGRQEAKYKLIYPQLADKIDAKYYSKKEENIGPISEIQPIIPITPPQTTAATPQVATSAVPGTDQGLTSTEMALLSPEEQLIKLRQKGVA